MIKKFYPMFYKIGESIIFKFPKESIFLLMLDMRSPSTDELYERHRHERIFIDEEDNDDRQDEANNEASDSQYAYRLREAMALEMWDANANRRAR
ncbi:hypothetical protein AAC387_Pa02g3391 [Persea americana]